KIVEFADRYMIDEILGKKSVGIYTFYNQIANLINVVIFTLVIMNAYPKLITHLNSNQKENFILIKSDMKRKIIVYSFGMAMILHFSIAPILDIMGKVEFYKEIYTFYTLLISNI